MGNTLWTSHLQLEEADRPGETGICLTTTASQVTWGSLLLAAVQRKDMVCPPSAKWQHVSDCSGSRSWPLPLLVCDPVPRPSLWRPLYLWSGPVGKGESSLFIPTFHGLESKRLRSGPRAQLVWAHSASLLTGCGVEEVHARPSCRCVTSCRKQGAGRGACVQGAAFRLAWKHGPRRAVTSAVCTLMVNVFPTPVLSSGKWRVKGRSGSFCLGGVRGKMVGSVVARKGEAQSPLCFIPKQVWFIEDCAFSLSGASSRKSLALQCSLSLLSSASFFLGGSTW